MLQTITKTSTQQVECCTHDSAFTVVENAQRLVTECLLEQDPTAARYFTQVAYIYAGLVDAYYTYADDDLVPVSAITDAITRHLIYVDDACIFTDCVANTDLASINVHDLTYLSN